MAVPSPIRFPTTDWKTVSRAGHGDPATRAQALGALAARYLPPMRSYLLARWKVRADRADDLLQEFLTSRVLEQDLVGRADRGRGKFRTFLLTALNRFVVSEFRREQAAKRGPHESAVPLAPDAHVPDPSQDGPDAFDLAWARHVLRLALARTRDECRALGRDDEWGVFEARVMLPALEGAPPVPLSQLVERYGFASMREGFNILATARRRFMRHLAEVVREYADDDEDDVEDEIRRLWRILGGDRA